MRRWLKIEAAEQGVPMYELVEKLLAKGKTKMQALVAVMRKLLHAIHGMLEHDQDFDGEKIFAVKGRPGREYLSDWLRRQSVKRERLFAPAAIEAIDGLTGPAFEVPEDRVSPGELFGCRLREAREQRA